MAVTGNEPVSVADLKAALDGLLDSQQLQAKIEAVALEAVGGQTYWVGSLSVTEFNGSYRISQSVERSQGLAFSLVNGGSHGVCTATMPLQAGTYRVAYTGDMTVTIGGTKVSNGTDKTYTVSAGAELYATHDTDYSGHSAAFTVYKMD